MAIIPDLPGLEFTVRVDGESLPEFTDPDPPPTPQLNVPGPKYTITKYVEVPVGRLFNIHSAIDRDFPYQTSDIALRNRVFVNGGWVNTKTQNFKALPKFKRPIKHVFEGKMDGDNIQPFQFVELTIDENSTSINHICRGTITVTVWRITSGRAGKLNAPDVEAPASRPGPVGKKDGGRAIDTGVAFGTPRYKGRGRKGTVTYDKGDTLESPLASIHFFIRSNEALKQLHIIRRTPTPPTLEDMAWADMTPEQQAALQTLLLERHLAEQKVRHEKGDKYLQGRAPPREAKDTPPADRDDDADLFHNQRKRRRAYTFSRQVSDDDEIEFVMEVPVKKKKKKKFYVNLTGDNDTGIICDSSDEAVVTGAGHLSAQANSSAPHAARDSTLQGVSVALERIRDLEHKRNQGLLAHEAYAAGSGMGVSEDEEEDLAEDVEGDEEIEDAVEVSGRERNDHDDADAIIPQDAKDFIGLSSGAQVNSSHEGNIGIVLASIEDDTDHDAGAE